MISRIFNICKEKKGMLPVGIFGSFCVVVFFISMIILSVLVPGALLMFAYNIVAMTFQLTPASIGLEVGIAIYIIILILRNLFVKE